MFMAVPETIWSARRWIAKTACTQRQQAAGDRRPDEPELPTSRSCRPT